MGWDKGKYYSRSKKVNGRVEREYIGKGELAQLLAQIDAAERDRRRAERAAVKAERAELDALFGALIELDRAADVLARAALTAAGYRRHNRGEWRKRRERSEPAA
jgi:hypothetical protein